jgi:hypothetical protein
MVIKNGIKTIEIKRYSGKKSIIKIIEIKEEQGRLTEEQLNAMPPRHG